MYMKHTAADYRRAFGLEADYTVDGVLACGVWDLFAEERHLPYLQAALERAGLPAPLKRIDNAYVGHAYEVEADGRRFWYVPVMGTAVMAQYLHVACLFGSTRNVLLGTVGGLARGMTTSDIVVPLAVEGNDNARMYDRDDPSGLHRPDLALVEEMRQMLPSGRRIWEGTTVTCEMMLAETESDVGEWSDAGFIGVEMEAAMCFAVSQYFGVPAAALLYVTDNLIENETVYSGTRLATKEARDATRAMTYQVGLQLLLAGARSSAVPHPIR